MIYILISLEGFFIEIFHFIFAWAGAEIHSYFSLSLSLTLFFSFSLSPSPDLSFSFTTMRTVYFSLLTKQFGVVIIQSSTYSFGRVYPSILLNGSMVSSLCNSQNESSLRKGKKCTFFPIRYICSTSDWTKKNMNENPLIKSRYIRWYYFPSNQCAVGVFLFWIIIFVSFNKKKKISINQIKSLFCCHPFRVLMLSQAIQRSDSIFAADLFHQTAFNRSDILLPWRIQWKLNWWTSRKKKMKENDDNAIIIE